MENKHLVFFGNGKLATGLSESTAIIDALAMAGFQIEQHITGPVSDLQPHKAQLAVLAAYGHVISQTVLDEFPLGIINLHPSLLPLCRGSTPIEQAILDGAVKTGVSIMKLTAGMDEGPLYKQKSVKLTRHETKAELAQKLQELGIELLLEVLPEIAGGKLKPKQQPHPDRATYTKRITKEDGRIDWTEPAEQIERQVRAYAGWPNSRTILGTGLDLIIHSAEVVDSENSEIKKIIISKDSLSVTCGDKALKITSLQPAGKPVIATSAFLNGYSNRLGTHAA